MTRRGGKRAGAGRPSGRKNKATAAQKLTLEELARTHTETALAVLVEVAQHGQSEAARVSAANSILDRGYGKPRQLEPEPTLQTVMAEHDVDATAKEKDMRVEPQYEDKIVMTGNSPEAELRPRINLKDAEVDQPWYSDPITVAQAKELISLLSERSVELLRQIVLGVGSITWPQVQKICGIKGTDFGQYHYQYGEKIEEAVRMVSQGEHRYVITYEDGAPAWDTDDWNDVKLEIDGPALMSLREVFAS
jgi:hypothetical protein